MATIITDAVRGEIAAFCAAFAERYMFQPPEFTDISYLDSFADLYERDLHGAVNPVNTEWFSRLQVSATMPDLGALSAAFNEDDMWETAIQRFVLRRLLRNAYRRDQAGMEVSVMLPAWYRAKGWGMPSNWNCERPAPPPPLEYRHAGCGVHEGLYDERGVHALGHSVTSGGIEPRCSCPPHSPIVAAAAAGTPPGSPLGGPAPPPMWRTGSCGESGPFIGLSYPYSIALVKRMDADPDGHRNAFDLKAEVCALPEPDVLRDFTVQEVIDGMAASYSWDRARTLAWLADGARE